MISFIKSFVTHDLPKWFWGLPVLLLLAFLTRIWISPDIWRHLHRAVLIIETGNPNPPTNLIMQHPYGTFHWLYQLFFLKIYSFFGVAGTTIMFQLIWLFIFLFVIKFSGLHKTGFAGWIWFTVSIFLCSGRFFIRPEVFSFLFTVVFIWGIIRWSRAPRTTWKSILQYFILFSVLQILWANMHASFPLGPALIGLYGCVILIFPENVLQGSRFKQFFIFLFLSCWLAICSMISPFGYRNWEAVITQLFLFEGATGWVTELNSPFSLILFNRLWIYKLFWFSCMMIFLLIVYNGVRKKTVDYNMGLALAGLFISAGTVKFMPFFVLMSTPLWASVFYEFKRENTAQPGRYVKTGVLLMGLAGISVCIFMIGTNKYYYSTRSLNRFGYGISRIQFPVEIKDYLLRHPFEGRVFNSPDVGDYLEYNIPDLKLYGDSLITNGTEVVEYYLGQDPDGFGLLDRKHNFDAVLLRIVRSPDLIEHLLRTNKWMLVYGDLFRALLVARDSPHAHQLPPTTPVFLDAHDLEFRLCSDSACTWARILCATDQRHLLKEFLKQFYSASFIPSDIIKTVLLYNTGRNDAELTRHVQNLASKIRFSNQRDRGFINLLLKNTVHQALR